MPFFSVALFIRSYLIIGCRDSKPRPLTFQIWGCPWCDQNLTSESERLSHLLDAHGVKVGVVTDPDDDEVDHNRPISRKSYDISNIVKYTFPEKPYTENVALWFSVRLGMLNSSNSMIRSFIWLAFTKNRRPKFSVKGFLGGNIISYIWCYEISPKWNFTERKFAEFAEFAKRKFAKFAEFAEIAKMAKIA